MQQDEPYTRIAPVYDYLLRHVDYQEWYEYIRSVMLEYCDDPQFILELGCGTGRFGAKFSNDRYNITGIDKSFEMLRIANTRAYFNFRIICADITRFALSKNADFIFCVHDTLNYLLKPSDIRKTFRSVKAVMHEKTVFMFDVTTEYNIDANFDGKKSVFRLRNQKVIWTNEYDRKKKLVYSTICMKSSGETRYREVHVQRIYTRQQIEKLLAEEGFEILGIYGDYSLNSPAKDTVMINFVTRKKSV